MWRKTNLIKTQEKNTVQCQRVKFSRNNNFLKTKKRGFNWATELHEVQFAINETPTEVFDYYNPFWGVHFHQDKNFLKKLVRLKRDGMCENNVECKENYRNTYKKDIRFHPMFQQEDLIILKKKLYKESCLHTSILSAIRCRMEAIPNVG